MPLLERAFDDQQWHCQTLVDNSQQGLLSFLRVPNAQTSKHALQVHTYVDNVSIAPSQLRAAELPIKDSVTKKERVSIANTRCTYLIELLSYLNFTDQSASAPS